jgi:hypothetical protein
MFQRQFPVVHEIRGNSGKRNSLRFLIKTLTSSLFSEHFGVFQHVEGETKAPFRHRFNEDRSEVGVPGRSLIQKPIRHGVVPDFSDEIFRLFDPLEHEVPSVSYDEIVCTKHSLNEEARKHHRFRTS